MTQPELLDSLGSWKKNRLVAKMVRFSNAISIYTEHHIKKLCKRLPERQATYLQMIYDAVNEIYPENFQFKVTLQPRLELYHNEYGMNSNLSGINIKGVYVQKMYLIIRFPEFTIRNSDREQQPIKELFMRLEIDLNDTNRLIISNLAGMRMRVTAEQFKSGYTHSHLPGWSNNDTVRHGVEHTSSFFSYCVGAADFVAALMQVNSQMVDGELDVEMAKLMFLSIETLVHWESLEGVPYRKMRTINTKKELSVGSDSVGDRLFWNIIRKKLLERPLDIDWTYSAGRWLIVDNRKFDKLFQDIYDELYGSSPTNDESRLYRQDILKRFFITDAQGKFFKITEEEAIVPHGLHLATRYKFRNQTFLFYIEPPVQQQNRVEYDRTRININPTIKKYVRLQLEYKQRQDEIKALALRRLSSLVHTGEVGIEDQVSLYY